MDAGVRITTLAVAAALALAGCAPSTPADDPSDGAATPAASSTPEPAAAPLAMPEFAGQEVLQISATATAGNGATMDVTQVTYYPVTVESDEGQQALAYLESIGAGGEVDAAPGTLLQLSRLTATAGSGSWPGESGVLPALGPGDDDTIVGIPAGPIVGNRLSITGPGSGWGVAVLANEDGSPSDPAQWANRFTYYGFFDGFAGASLTNCSLQVTPLGSGSAGVANWTPHTCYTGIGD